VKQFVGSAEQVRQGMERVRARVDAAARRAGRDPAGVEVVLATKYLAAEHMGELLAAGITLVGENRAQDLVAKHRLYGDAFTWDFIGHLQSRKTKLVLPLVRLIHSVDSLSAVQELQRRTQKKVSVLLEVNIAGEDSKSGVPAAEVEAFLQAASDVAMVDFSGLMCMPPLGDPAASARHFARTRELAASLTESWRGRYTFDALSMGTSSDYEAAVQEGATIVRIGSGVLFRQTLEG